MKHLEYDVITLENRHQHDIQLQDTWNIERVRLYARIETALQGKRDAKLEAKHAKVVLRQFAGNHISVC